MSLREGINASPIVYIPHYHLNYIDEALSAIAREEQISANLIFEYDKTRAQVDFTTKTKLAGGTSKELPEVLNAIVANEEFKVDRVSQDYKFFILKNVVRDLVDRPDWLLLLQTFVAKYERGEYNAKTTIILVDSMPVVSLPTVLADIVTVVEVPLPTHDEIRRLVDEIPVAPHLEAHAPQLREDLCRNLQGLPLFEINQIIRSAACRSNGKLTTTMISYVLKGKQAIIKKNGIIEVCEPDVTFAQIGGLEALIEDLERKSVVYHNLREVQKLKLPLPKGVLIIGMPGCGKSMIAKAIASKFEVSLLRLDVSRLMGKYVGESEENLRRALAMAEAAHPCVLWIDEIEKAFAGANGGGNEGDMLVQRMMGHFLTWMQEHKSAVYIVATANDAMRPEFMRKGRFDEVYFVDFPNTNERKAIFEKSIARYYGPQYKALFDFSSFSASELDKVIKQMDQFAGAEIVSVINTVIERRYIDFVQARKANNDQAPAPLPITVKHFESVISELSSSIMSKQGKKSDQGDPSKATPIQKIREMQEIYKFKPASKPVK